MAIVPNHDDDLVLPFRVENADASGRLVRLGSAIDEILTRHDYPLKVSELLGEALLLVSLFGSTMKDRLSNGVTNSLQEKQSKNKERFILQTQTDGPVSLIVADYHHPGHLRGYVRFDADRVEQTDKADLLGRGHLAMTIDRGTHTDQYQGIVALNDKSHPDGSDSLTEATNRYFDQSEQLPTQIHLATARHFDGQSDDTQSHPSGWRWRGGALLIQKLTSIGGHATSKPRDWPHTEEGAGLNDEDDRWNRVQILASSIKKHELTDPLLAAPNLLLRLFHEDGVRAFDAAHLEAGCSCSQEGVTRMLSNFPEAEQAGMVKEDGLVHITCEFCNRKYQISPTG